MTTRLRLVPCALALVALVACGQGDRADQAMTPASDPAESQERARAGTMDTLEFAMTTGRLVDVDLDAKTLMLTSSDGRQHRFAFSDETTVIGANGVQGLAGDLGADVIVYYNEDPARTIPLARKIQFR